MSVAERVVFWVVFLAAWLFFARSMYRIIRYFLIGRRETRWDNISDRLEGLIVDVFAQREPLRYPTSGIKHFLIFWGFIFVGIETLELWGKGLFGWDFHLLGGGRYKHFLFFEDIVCALVVFALLWALVQRLIIRVKRLENTPEAFIIIALIFILMITHFTLTGAKAYFTSELKILPISSYIGDAYGLLGLEVEDVVIVCKASWWIHVLTVLFFLNYLPISKHAHIIFAAFNVFFRNMKRRGYLEKLDLEKLEKGEIKSYGVTKIEDFTWKQLMDFYSCTECGRCWDNCPARITGKPLSPREIVKKLKEKLKHDAPIVIRGSEEEKVQRKPMVDGELITEEEIWSCTTCSACEEICPVKIEHPRFIIDLRRALIFEGKLSGTPAKTIQRIERQGNPWGLPPEDRDSFAKDVGLRVLEEGEKAETIWWIGCTGYYDPIGQRIVKALARIFRSVGLEIPVLGAKEFCTADSVRRIGEEGLFTIIAQQNIQTLKEFGVKNIVTHCPHCFHTLKNDYADFGAEFEVVHHTTLLLELIGNGRLRLGRFEGTLTYHDSCYLGRYNGIYETPRSILISTGAILKEPARRRERGFCCGAGGGMMWFEETGKRINVERLEQILGTGSRYIVTACPFCLLMLDDACKFKDIEDEVKVKDISEIIAELLS